KRLMRMEHKKPWVLVLLAELNAEDGLAGEAAVCYLSAAEMDLAAGDSAAAIQRLEAAVALSPLHADCSRPPVQLHHGQGHPDAAARELLRLGEALHLSGRDDASKAVLARAHQLDPGAELPSYDSPAMDVPQQDPGQVVRRPGPIQEAAPREALLKESSIKD